MPHDQYLRKWLKSRCMLTFASRNSPTIIPNGKNIEKCLSIFPFGKIRCYFLLIFPNGIIEGATMKLELPPRPRRSDGKISNASDLGAILRERRKSLGLTQGQLAAACHCSPRFVSELERGIAGGNIKQVIEVCREVGIDLFARARG